MGVLECPKHGLAGPVVCCQHVAGAVAGSRPLAEGLHGPRDSFRWCACPECAAAPQAPFGGVASAMPSTRGVCSHCVAEWWAAHQSGAA